MRAIALMLALGASTLLADGENALENPSFAVDKFGRMAAWRMEALEHVTVKGTGPENADVLRLPLRNGRAYVVQSGLLLDEGTLCRFGAWIRTRGLSKRSARLVLFNDEWKMGRSVSLPEDTRGEWQKLEWSGELMPGGPYGFAVHVELPVADGLVEVAAPFVISEARKARADGKLIFHFDFNSLQRTKEAVIAELRHVAAAGYDAVLWEIENAVRFDCCPEIAAPDAFSKLEFREILAEARRLGLEPIPLMQTFGHGEYVLRHDKYRSLREVAERYDCYCPSKPATRAFLKALLHEYLEIFGPDVKRFHLGGDEAWFYRTCRTCQTREPLELYIEHLEAVGAELREKGIHPGCWHDMVVKFCRESGSRLELFKDYTVWFWDYAYPKSWHPWGQADAPLRELRETGCETIICGSAQSWKEDPFLVRFGAHRGNLAACAALARREKLSGFCVTSWTIHQGLKRLQRPLFDFAAKRYRDPSDDEARDWRDAVSRAFGNVPLDALDALSDWEVRYGNSDGRGWDGYKDGSVPPRAILPWRFKNPKTEMPKLAAELDAVRTRTASALEKIRATSDLTPLGRLMLEAGELKLLQHDAAIRALRGEPVGAVPFDRTVRHYATEYSSESSVRAARIVYNL